MVLSRLVCLCLLLFWVMGVSWFESFGSCNWKFFFLFSGWLALWVVGLAVVGLFGWGDLVVQSFYLVRVVIKGGHCA